MIGNGDPGRDGDRDSDDRNDHDDHDDRNDHHNRDGQENGTESVVGGDEYDTVPDVVAVRDRILSHLVEFVRALRRAGVSVPANAGVTAAEALVEIGFDDEEHVRAALKATLVSREADIAAFDRLFVAFWRQLTDDLYARDTGGEDNRKNVGGFAPLGADPQSATDTDDGDDVDTEQITSRTTNWQYGDRSAGDDPDEDEPPIETALYSSTGRSEPLSVSATLDSDADSLDRVLRRLTRALATQHGRRWEANGTERADARRALRRSFGTGGTVISLPYRRRKRTALNCVLLVDVSRSVLDTIDRAFLIRFLRAATAEWRTTRTFLFDTSVREVSKELEAPSAEATIEAFRRAETEWGGGTRIGNALSSIRHEHPDAIDFRTTVFVISDGLEMGEVPELEAGMSWLSRRAQTVLWGNPLASSPEYEPTARGMAVSMPYLDGLFAFRGTDDVNEIARQLERQGTTASAIGYEYDPRRRARE